MHALAGRTLSGTRVAGRDVELVVSWFAVVPNPVLGQGPVVGLAAPGSMASDAGPWRAQGERGRWFLPVLTDGDAADLVRRVTGEEPRGFGGERSARYRATLGLD